MTDAKENNLCVLPHIFEPKHQRPTIINCVARSKPLPIGTLCAYEHFGWNIIIGHHHHQQHEQRWVLCVCAYENFRVNFKQYFGTRTSSPTMSVGPKPFCIIATRNTVCLRALWARTICRFSIFRQLEGAVDHPHLSNQFIILAITVSSKSSKSEQLIIPLPSCKV